MPHLYIIQLTVQLESVSLDKIIYRSINLNCSPSGAFEFFTVNERLEKWLTGTADVEPVVGGKYELFWNPTDRENDSTIGCKVLALTKNKLICFEWKGPKHFKHFMNNVRPLTNVAVYFAPNPEGTEVHLLHTGWRDTDEWEEAREWFVRAWNMSLNQLQKCVEKSES